MSGAALLIVLTAFAASAVELVEALTIVLAMGVARGWRSSLLGAGSGLAVLAVLTAAVGVAITAIPIDALRLVVGGLLLVLGLQWLRKAILRAAGLKALHDEDAVFASELAAARSATPGHRAGVDGYGFVLAFKAVLLEGLEVVFIVLGFSSHHDGVALAAAGAGAAVVAVAVAGVAVHAPLSRVPENSLKLVVGVMLTTFGTFWAVEGAGGAWPGGDVALPALLLLYAGLTALLVRGSRVPRAVPA